MVMVLDDLNLSEKEKKYVKDILNKLELPLEKYIKHCIRIEQAYRYGFLLTEENKNGGCGLIE